MISRIEIFSKYQNNEKHIFVLNPKIKLTAAVLAALAYMKKQVSEAKYFHAFIWHSTQKVKNYEDLLQLH